MDCEKATIKLGEKMIIYLSMQEAGEESTHSGIATSPAWTEPGAAGGTGGLPE